MSGIFLKQTYMLVRFFFRNRYWRGLPENDPLQHARCTCRFLQQAEPSFLLLYRACIVSLHLLSMFFKGKTFNRLHDTQQQQVMDRLLISASPLLRGLPILLSAPVFTSLLSASGSAGEEKTASSAGA